MNNPTNLYFKSQTRVTPELYVEFRRNSMQYKELYYIGKEREKCRYRYFFPEVYDVVFTTGAVSVLVSKYLDMYCIQGPSKLCRSHNKQ